MRRKDDVGIVLATIAGLASHNAEASGSIGYGSRAGMQVSVISMSGIDTTHAIIKTRHTKEDAIAFCREYIQKVTPECVKRELEVPLNDEVEANCITGEFTDFYGSRFRFEGPRKAGDEYAMAKYVLRDLATGQVADGSSASGYPTALGILHHLCPSIVPIVE